jgi:hypothetical protein
MDKHCRPVIALIRFLECGHAWVSAGSMGSPLRTGFYVQQSVVDRLCARLPATRGPL